MLTFRTLAAVAIASTASTFGLVGCAQTPADHSAHLANPTPAAGMPMPMGGAGAPMARMDEQMVAMQAMHDKMVLAKTPDQRSALMAEHMKIMQDSMTMMDGKGAMHGMHGMQGMQGKGPMDADMAMRHQMTEKRMQMMHSMMQMMMDRMPPAPAKP